MKLTVFSLLMIISLTGCFGKEHEGKFSVVNRSSENIPKIEVTIAGQTKTFENLKPSERQVASYKVKSDDHFRVVGQLQSGRKLEREDGYITNGMDFEHEIAIDDKGEVQVKQISAK